jgi:hypothetical protein
MRCVLSYFHSVNGMPHVRYPVHYYNFFGSSMLKHCVLEQKGHCHELQVRGTDLGQIYHLLKVADHTATILFDFMGPKKPV